MHLALFGNSHHLLRTLPNSTWPSWRATPTDKQIKTKEGLETFQSCKNVSRSLKRLVQVISNCFCSFKVSPSNVPNFVARGRALRSSSARFSTDGKTDSAPRIHRDPFFLLRAQTQRRRRGRTRPRDRPPEPRGERMRSGGRGSGSRPRRTGGKRHAARHPAFRSQKRRGRKRKVAGDGLTRKKMLNGKSRRAGPTGFFPPCMAESCKVRD